MSSGFYPKLYKILRHACEGLKIPYRKKIEVGLILHTARHTITTRLVEAGLDYDTIGMITDHKAKELIAHYSHKHTHRWRGPRRRSNKLAFVMIRPLRSLNLIGQIVDK